ncbi:MULTISPECIES: hypothetical protein [Marinobacter]|uniref:hypothetical protein n=1 Tax=Marinobacter TaxID=2742 RepID=UPI0013A6BD40|nr:MULTISPECIES: hypothetical protein [Marinobacter]
MSTMILNTHRRSLRGFDPARLTLVRRWRIWRRRAANRRALRDEFGRATPAWLAHMERDIGLEPGSLQREMNKPFWQE